MTNDTENDLIIPPSRHMCLNCRNWISISGKRKIFYFDSPFRLPESWRSVDFLQKVVIRSKAREVQSWLHRQ